MNTDLTDQAIESSKRAEKIATAPVLNVNNFIDNVKKLSEHQNKIDRLRETIHLEAKNDRKLMKETTWELKQLKILNQKTQKELNNVLNVPTK